MTILLIASWSLQIWQYGTKTRGKLNLGGNKLFAILVILVFPSHLSSCLRHFFHISKLHRQGKIASRLEKKARKANGFFFVSGEKIEFPFCLDGSGTLGLYCTIMKPSMGPLGPMPTSVLLIKSTLCKIWLIGIKSLFLNGFGMDILACLLACLLAKRKMC